MALNTQPITSCTNPSRGNVLYTASWGACGDNPSLNTLFDIIDANSQVKFAYIVAHNCNADFVVANDNSNASSQIQLAIDTARSKYGRVIIIDDADYVLSTPITITGTSYNGLIVEGSSDKATMRGASGQNIINATDVERLEIRNLVFNLGNVAINGTNLPFLRLVDNTFVDINQGGIIITNTNQFEIISNKFTNIGIGSHNTYDAITLNTCTLGNVMNNYQQELSANKARRFLTASTSINNSIAFNKIVNTVDPTKISVPVGNDVLSNF